MAAKKKAAKAPAKPTAGEAAKYKKLLNNIIKEVKNGQIKAQCSAGREAIGAAADAVGADLFRDGVVLSVEFNKWPILVSPDGDDYDIEVTVKPRKGGPQFKPFSHSCFDCTDKGESDYCDDDDY